MLFLYNLGIRIYICLVRLVSFFNPKAKLWTEGQRRLLARIAEQVDVSKRKIWFHFPSLGEFEQGRPVLEKIKQKYPEKLIVITFFSPSGYEIRKNYPLADHVFYLPIDTLVNARKFISMINPEIAIFTKYDYWYHYFNELNKRKVPLFVVSAFFWKELSFFKWYGGFQRRMLACITEIFVQDEESKTLLNKIGILNVTVSGDTRFDRVAENADNPKAVYEIQAFCGDSAVFIAGSSWLQDEKLIANLADGYPDWKLIIAPHEVTESRINDLIGLFPKALKYSDLRSQPSAVSHEPLTINHRILIIDNIGLLSSLYQYAHIAYIGGGFGAGIHNTLEAAAFNLPVIFGPNYHHFREARSLISEGAAFSIKNSMELGQTMSLLQDPGYRSEAGRKAGEYVRAHTGATRIIVEHIAKHVEP